MQILVRQLPFRQARSSAACRQPAHQRRLLPWRCRASGSDASGSGSASNTSTSSSGSNNNGASSLAKLGNKSYLDAAAKRFRIGLENGMSEDELVAWEMGATQLSDLTELQQEYAGKVKDRLSKRAEELRLEEAERRLREARNLEAGKKAYERGLYPESVKLLEAAVDDVGRETVLGGEAQLWLALAYQAVGREEECIELYKWLEENHPVRKIKKQAGDLRYIMEAPKLPLGPDERVQIPLIQSDTWRRDERKTYTPKFITPQKAAAPKKEPSYWDRVEWDLQVPFVPDKWYYRVAWLVLIVCVTVYVNLHYGGGAVSRS